MTINQIKEIEQKIQNLNILKATLVDEFIQFLEGQKSQNYKDLNTATQCREKMYAFFGIELTKQIKVKKDVSKKKSA